MLARMVLARRVVLRIAMQVGRVLRAITETAGSQSVNWSVTSTFSDVTFTPSNGSVSVDNPNKVSMTIPANDCQNNTFNFNFTEGVKPIATLWNCIQEVEELKDVRSPILPVKAGHVPHQ